MHRPGCPGGHQRPFDLCLGQRRLPVGWRRARLCRCPWGCRPVLRSCRRPGPAGRRRPRPQHHGCVRLLAPQDPGGLDAVHPGHAQVHEHHVGVMRGGLAVKAWAPSSASPTTLSPARSSAERMRVRWAWLSSTTSTCSCRSGAGAPMCHGNSPRALGGSGRAFCARSWRAI